MGKPSGTGSKPGIGTSAMTETMMAANPVLAEAWNSFMAESSQFLTKRLQQDLDTQRAMMACKSPAELLKLQTEFLSTAMDHYTEYTTRLYKAMSTAMSGPLPKTRSGLSRRYDDIPL